MNVNKLCLCCNKESTFYKNLVKNKIAAYCLDYTPKYSPAEKRKRELQNVMGLILCSKEINEKCSRL